ncbi:MAG: putative motility protein [Oscillospiraceae bacterium]
MDDMIMSIASMSMSMSQASLANSVDIAMLGKAMDTQQQAMDTLLSGMPQAAPSSFGHDFDVMV